MGLTFKEIGRLTLRTFNKLYQCYKNDFDFEMSLKRANITYQEFLEKQMKDEEWLD